MAQDDYYYEIQLTNKQLVFYFMAGAAGLILSFLAGVMVGRGVDSTTGEVQAARPVQEDRLVAEESPAAQSSPPPAEDLTYAQRLEGDKVDDSLTKGSSGKSSGKLAQSSESARTPTSGAAPSAAPEPAKGKAQAKADAKSESKADAKTDAAKPARDAKAGASPSGPTAFTIQVGAFKDKASADSVVNRLKGKGFPAYAVAPEGTDGGLFNVRVGSYPQRADAERIQGRLKDEEKFNPFIVKQ